MAGSLAGPSVSRTPRGAWISYLEGRVSRTGKIVLAWGAGLSLLGSVLGAAVFVDNIYVHKTVFVARENQVEVRFDRSEVRGLAQERTLVTGQIFTLERQPTLTRAESAFLNDLKARQYQIEQEMTGIQQRLQQTERPGAP